MDKDNKELFITEIDSERKINSLELLNNVRKEHMKVRDVVVAFRNKVDNMIEKQRQEYIQAYETHMQDVQKELHNLREKVFEIANDETKNERTEKLKGELKYLKQLALQLETNSDELRTKMANLVKKIYSVEKSRDWMLMKLRKAKKKYNQLITTKAQLYEDSSIASASISNGSSYTLELITNPSINKQLYKQPDSKDRFQRGIRSHITVKRDFQLPNIHSKSSSNLLEPIKPLQPIIALDQTNRPVLYQDNLGQLISSRTILEELKEFVRNCRGSLNRRPWSKVHKRDIQELLAESMQLLQTLQTTKNPKLLLPLVCELVAYDETYAMVLELLEEKIDLPDPRIPSPTNIMEESMDLNHVSYMEDEILNWIPK